MLKFSNALSLTIEDGREKRCESVCVLKTLRGSGFW